MACCAPAQLRQTEQRLRLSAVLSHAPLALDIACHLSAVCCGTHEPAPPCFPGGMRDNPPAYIRVHIPVPPSLLKEARPPCVCPRAAAATAACAQPAPAHWRHASAQQGG